VVAAGRGALSNSVWTEFTVLPLLNLRSRVDSILPRTAGLMKVPRLAVFVLLFPASTAGGHAGRRVVGAPART
jgi:hypothetical protein